MPEKEPQSCATPFRTMIGGQALIEGIMMLGPEKKSIVVRRPDGGLEIKTEERKLIKDRHPILGWPFIRGVVNFCTSMYTGVTALMYSAEFYPEDEAGEEEPSRFEQWLDKKLGSEKAMSLFTTLAVILGCLLYTSHSDQAEKADGLFLGEMGHGIHILCTEKTAAAVSCPFSIS